MNFIHMGLRFTVSRGTRSKRMLGVNCLHIPSSEVALSAHSVPHTHTLYARAFTHFQLRMCVCVCVCNGSHRSKNKKKHFLSILPFTITMTSHAKTQCKVKLCYCRVAICVLLPRHQIFFFVAVGVFRFFRSSIRLLFTRLLFACV